MIKELEPWLGQRRLEILLKKPVRVTYPHSSKKYRGAYVSGDMVFLSADFNTNLWTSGPASIILHELVHICQVRSRSRLWWWMAYTVGRIRTSLGRGRLSLCSGRWHDNAPQEVEAEGVQLQFQYDMKGRGDLVATRRFFEAYAERLERDVH